MGEWCVCQRMRTVRALVPNAHALVTYRATVTGSRVLSESDTHKFHHAISIDSERSTGDCVVARNLRQQEVLSG